MKNILLLYLGVAMFYAFPAVAKDKHEGRKLAELTFEATDSQGKGYINQGDMEQMRSDIFISMDTDEDNYIELNEFLNWDYGFSNIAEEQNKMLAYLTALRVVFSFWDRNGDGKISQTEHRKSLIEDFNRADVNDDAILEKNEFIRGFSILVALKAALKPQ